MVFDSRVGDNKMSEPKYARMLMECKNIINVIILVYTIILTVKNIVIAVILAAVGRTAFEK